MFVVCDKRYENSEISIYLEWIIREKLDFEKESKIWNLWKIEYQNALNKAKSSYGIKTDQLSLNKICFAFEKTPSAAIK